MKAFQKLGRQMLDQHILFDVLPDDLATPETLTKYQATLNPAKDSVPSIKSVSRFDAPNTLRVSASHPAEKNEINLHFVNYDRDELPKRANGKPNHGRGPADERPKPVSEVSVSFALPQNYEVSEVEILSPEYDRPAHPKFKMAEGRISFTLPKFLVYAVARLKP